MDCRSCWMVLTVGALAVTALGMVIAWLTRPAPFKPEGRTVLITGGSSGIGKALAKQLVAAGCHVAILARRPEVLETAKTEIEACRAHPDVRVSTHAVNVCNQGAVEAVMADVLETHNNLHAVVCSAGASLPQHFLEISAKEWEEILQVNVVGTRNAIASALPALIRHKDSRIVMVSSQAGQAGIYGYTAYSASKFALRGFAESLQMELAPFGTRVCLAYPPDTDTPMFAEENRVKPKETTVIVGVGNVFSAERVADDIFRGMAIGSFTISTGFDGWMLRQVHGAFGPSLFGDMVVEALTSGPLRVVAWFIRNWFDRKVRSMYRARLDTKCDNLLKATAAKAAAGPPTV